MAGGAGAGAGAAAAAAAAIAQAVKASGAIVRMEPSDFQTILERAEEPLLVVAESGVFSTSYEYLTSYKGLIFYTKTKKTLSLPSRVEVIKADKIWVP